MIDLIVVVQAIVAGMILYRSASEEHAWDRAGFALLACCAGLMTIRRVTASLDRYASLDQIILPHVITWIMLASATCFGCELLHRSLLRAPNRPRVVGLRAAAKFVWPFVLMLLMSASEFIPSPSNWDGQKIRALTAEEALQEALGGVNPAAACEAVRRHSARGIDVLRIKAGSDDVDAMAALQKLRALAVRVNEAVRVREAAIAVPPAPELRK
jgi:hypothetical protein